MSEYQLEDLGKPAERWPAAVFVVVEVDLRDGAVGIAPGVVDLPRSGRWGDTTQVNQLRPEGHHTINQVVSAPPGRQQRLHSEASGITKPLKKRNDKPSGE